MTPLLDVDRVRVLLAGNTVGMLTITFRTLAFAYDKTWLTHGFSISDKPSAQRWRVRRPKRSAERHVRRVRRQHARRMGTTADRPNAASTWHRPYSVGPLARLSIVGHGGMGALEYEPASTIDDDMQSFPDLDSLAEECLNVLSADFSNDLDQLFVLGGSSGGAARKSSPQSMARNGSSSSPHPWTHPISARWNTTYRILHALAESTCRKPGCSLHVDAQAILASSALTAYRSRTAKSARCTCFAGGLLETSHRIANLDYALLMRLTMRMTGGIKECERLYRLMCFNVFIGNRDDHAKNFSYLHDAESGAWSLSPAYDLTENPGINGEHTTAVNGKGRGITVEDMADIGMKAASHEPDAYRLRGTCANASRMPVLPYATEGGPNTFERTRPHRKSIQRKRSSSRASRRAWCGCGRASGRRIRQVFHRAELSGTAGLGQGSQRFQRHIRGGLPQQLAYPSQGLSDSHRRGRTRLLPRVGQGASCAQPRRRGVRGAGDQALAWGRAGFRLRAYRHHERGGRRSNEWLEPVEAEYDALR